MLDLVQQVEGGSIKDCAEKLANWFGLNGERPARQDAEPRKLEHPEPKPALANVPLKDKWSKPGKPSDGRLKGIEYHPYLEGRGFTKGFCEEHGIGYCSKGKMAGRVVFPICNVAGDVVAYCGRAVDAWLEPRWLQSDAFHKSLELYGIEKAAGRSVVIVESFWGVLACARAELPIPAVALMGKTMSEEQCKLLDRFSEYTLLLDGNAKKESAEIGKRLLEKEKTTRVFLADHPFYTKRFAHYVGRRCRAATIKDLAAELHLDWDTVKTLETQSMRAPLANAGTPGPQAIGIDEISIRNGHSDRIVGSDLIRRRPIWFGGEDRSEARMAQCYDWLGDTTSRHVRLAVMDRWKPFRHTATARAPQAAILFDTFHIVRHLGDALDTVRKAEYARLSGRDRRFIKGQQYTRLSRREHLSLEGRQSLKTRLAANKRLNTAYLLKESFGQRWADERAGWARRFFQHWRASLTGQRLKPYEQFAELIDRHWDGIAASCTPEHKVSLGFVEGLNNKIRVRQRRAYGLRDEEYLRLKILTCMRPAL